MLTASTPQLNLRETVRRWHLIDGRGIVLGRLAALAAGLLRGKGKTTFSPHIDQGDGVVVINAAQVLLTGKKREQKIDFRSAGHVGRQVYTPYGRLMDEKPERAVELAVSGMLPKNRLRSHFFRRLKVFRTAEGTKQYPGAVPVDMTQPKLRSGGPFVVPAASR